MKNRKIKLNQGDVVLKEVWRIKDELSASYGHDVRQLFEETRKHEELYEAQGWKFAPLPESQEVKEASFVLREKPQK